MHLLNKAIREKVERPITVMQFGEGNFLRAFADYMIDIANEKNMFNGNIVIVKPRKGGNLYKFKAQDYNYTVSLRGLKDGKRVEKNRIITSVADVISAYDDYDKYMEYALSPQLRFIISNTTEAGIVFDNSDKLENSPPETYPAKLCKLLFERYTKFKGDNSKGLIILPVELIDDNGFILKQCVEKYIEIWKLPDNFKIWIESACIFASTLVDRIVTGYPFNEDKKMWNDLGYQDNLIVTAEPFSLWVIQSDKKISEEFLLDRAGLPVIFTQNLKPYKKRKVRILNGAHTSFALWAFMLGHNTVLEAMHDPKVYNFVKDTIFNEIIPVLDMPKKELEDFANSVIERFMNPYINHQLLSISLNSVSKWKVRVLPTIIDYENKFHKEPKNLMFSLIALSDFYRTGTEIKDGALIGHRNGEDYEIHDDMEVLKFFLAHNNVKK